MGRVLLQGFSGRIALCKINSASEDNDQHFSQFCVFLTVSVWFTLRSIQLLVNWALCILDFFLRLSLFLHSQPFLGNCFTSWYKIAYSGQSARMSASIFSEICSVSPITCRSQILLQVVVCPPKCCFKVSEMSSNDSSPSPSRSKH